MFTMNAKMRNFYRGKSTMSGAVDLLQEISSSGFSQIGSCFVLNKCFAIDTNVSSSDFPDETGYECFINSVNIDDYVSEDYLEHALWFVKEIFSSWASLKVSDELVAILSMDEFGLKVKFHVMRTGKEWLSDDLESYDEAILIISSSEHIKERVLAG